ncbi:RhoGEF domain containing protein [Entamoeba marina]
MSSERDHIVNEIFQSELSYFHALDECRTYYYDDMICRSDNIIPLKDVKEIFLGFNEVIVVSQYLLTLMKEMKENNVLNEKIQKAFIEIVPFMQKLCIFVGNNQTSTELLAKSIGKNNKIKLYLEQIRISLPTRPQLDLKSFLIMPVQRTPRYVMLLESLLKKTDNNTEIYSEVEHALNLIRTATTDINTYVPEFERLQKLRNIKPYIRLSDINNLYTKGRNVISTGSSLKHTYIFLTDYIAIVENNKSTIQPLCLLSLYSPRMAADWSSVTISNNNVSVKLEFANQEETERFITIITNQICSVICFDNDANEKCVSCGRAVCKKCNNEKGCLNCRFESIKTKMSEVYLVTQKKPIILMSEKELNKAIKAQEELKTEEEMYVDQSKQNKLKSTDPFLSFLESGKQVDVEFVVDGITNKPQTDGFNKSDTDKLNSNENTTVSDQTQIDKVLDELVDVDI